MFLQQKWGQCGYVCVANFLNNPNVILDTQDFSKGLNWLNTQRLIEHYSDYTCKGVFKTRTPYNGDFDFFNVDEDIDDNNDHYVVFIASLQLKPKVGHAILVIKENHNKTLTVFDPLKAQPYNVNQSVFFKQHDCISLQMVCAKDGSEMFFYRNFLTHLLDN